jgi:Flp pilus assembly protein TadG
MRNLLRCRRGSTAFATAAALVPLIGVVALGVEAGSWYVTKQHAQTAADAAAVAGAWRLAWKASDSVSVAQTFAAKNGFCDGCKPMDATQSVSVDSPDAGSVHVKVSQQQPPYLARVLLASSPINIGAQATAVVDTTTAKAPCILATSGSVSFQGSPTVNSQTCGIASNSTASNAIAFTGNGSSIQAPSFTVGGCSETGGTQCSNNVYTSRPQPVPNPLSGLDSAMSSLTTSDFSGPCVGIDAKGKSTPTLKAYTPTTPCYNTVPPSGALNGTYFFNAPVTINGNTTISGTANLILFGGATLSISGNPSIQLTASTNPQVPPALSSVQSLMIGLLIYDPEAPANGNFTVKIGGDSNSYFNGIVYVPKSPVTYTGNSSATAPSPGCYQVIAYAITFSGNTNLDNTNCIDSAGNPYGIKKVPFVRLLPP